MNIEGKTDKQLRRMCVNSWKRKLKLTVEDIRKGEEAPDSSNCAFCMRDTKSPLLICRSCPIYKTTGVKGCIDTPHTKAAHLYYVIENDIRGDINKFHKAVQKEIAFLESLEC